MRHILCNRLRFWLPLFTLVLFTLGILWVCVFPAHAQPSHYPQQAYEDPNIMANYADIASLKRQLSDLGDVQNQYSGMRERVTMIEAHVAELTEKVNKINTTEDWVVFGVFGLLGTQIVGKFRFNPNSGAPLKRLIITSDEDRDDKRS